MRTPLLILLAAASAVAARAEDFAVPTNRDQPAAFGMGNAGVADGSWYYAADMNPALLQRAPRRYEVVNVGATMNTDLQSTVKYLKDNKDRIRDIYKDIKNGNALNDPSIVDRALDAVQGIVDRVGDKPYGVSASPAVAVRLGDHWGIEAYNNTHLLTQVSVGDLTHALLAIPRPIDLNSPQFDAMVNQLTASVQKGIDNALTASEQAALTNEINAFVNGVNDMDTFLNNVSTMTAEVDVRALAQSILTQLQADLATLQIVGFSDTVGMLTYATRPLDEDLPGLTVGANLKAVNRRIVLENFLPTELKGDLMNRILRKMNKQGTTRFGLDVGALYFHEPWGTSFGLSVQDLVKNRVTARGEEDSLINEFITDPAPTVVRAGVSWNPWRPLRVNVDLDDILKKTDYYQNGDGLSRLKAGAEYRLWDALALRGGYGNQAATAGFGVLWGFLGLDYALARDNYSQRLSHSAQFRLAFGGPSLEDEDAPLRSGRKRTSWLR